MIWTPTGWTGYRQARGLTIKEMVNAVKAAGLSAYPTDWTEAEMRHAEYVFDKAERAKRAHEPAPQRGEGAYRWTL